MYNQQQRRIIIFSILIALIIHFLLLNLHIIWHLFSSQPAEEHTLYPEAVPKEEWVTVMIDNEQQDFLPTMQPAAQNDILIPQESNATKFTTQTNTFDVDQENLIQDQLPMHQSPKDSLVTERKPSILKPIHKTDKLPEKKSAHTQLAHITQQFMHKMRQSQPSLTYEGHKEGTISSEQLIGMHYYTKILSSLVTAYQIKQNKVPHPCTQPQATIFSIALDKNGSLHTLYLIQSSKNTHIDTLLAEIIQYASSSFPPLPSALNQDILVFTITCDDIRLLQSTRYWSIK